MSLSDKLMIGTPGETIIPQDKKLIKEFIRELKESIPAKYVSFDSETESQGITWHDVIDKLAGEGLI